MSEKKPDYLVAPDSITIPRPEDIEVTVKHPTIEELNTYRLAWLKEGEESGVINDLIKIVKTLGAIGDYERHTWNLKCFQFHSSDNKYSIFHQNYTSVKSVSLYNVEFHNWDYVHVMENGEDKKEDYTGKNIVRYIKPVSEKENYASNKIKEVQSRNLFLPGDWELFIQPHAGLANDRLIKSKSQKTKKEREVLLVKLGLGGRIK